MLSFVSFEIIVSFKTYIPVVFIERLNENEFFMKSTQTDDA
jgi:hypothetical protein